MKCKDCNYLKNNRDAQYAKEHVCDKYSEGVSTNEMNEDVSCKGYEPKQ